MWERRVSRSARWSRRLGVFAAVLLIVASLSHRTGLLLTPDYLSVLVLVGAVALCALVFAGYGFSRFWRFGDRGGGSAVWGAFLALIVLAPYALFFWMSARLPPLTGVTTDLSDPPLFTHARQARAQDMIQLVATDTQTAAAQQEHYPDITGRRYELPLADVASEVEHLIETRGWQVTHRVEPWQGNADLTIEMVARTPVLGFVHDVAVRLTDEGESTFVDMRSVSRYGHHDIGDNARRVRAFLADLDEAVLNRPLR